MTYNPVIREKSLAIATAALGLTDRSKAVTLHRLLLDTNYSTDDLISTRASTVRTRHWLKPLDLTGSLLQKTMCSQ